MKEARWSWAVDEARQDGLGAYVQLLGTLRYCHRRAWPGGLDTAIVANEDGGIGQRLAAPPVDQCAANYRLHIIPPLNRYRARYH